MPRYNPFKLIHKALRALLYDTALAIQQSSFADYDEASEAFDKIGTVLYLIERHTRHEDKCIFPLIELYEPDLVLDFELQHQELRQLSTGLKQLINVFEASSLPEDLIDVGSAISNAYVSFMVFNLNHMAKEEIDVNNALWHNFTDEQLVLVDQRIARSIPSEEKILIAKWMIRALNNAEAVEWLGTLRASAPDFVFQSIFSLTESELPEGRRDKVQFGVISRAPVRNHPTEMMMAS